MHELRNPSSWIKPKNDLWGAILVSKSNNMCKWLNGGFLFNFGVRPQLLSTNQSVVSRPVLSTVVNEVRRSEPVVHNHCPLCWRHQSRTRSGPASFHSAIFLFNTNFTLLFSNCDKYLLMILQLFGTFLCHIWYNLFLSCLLNRLQ